MCYRVRFYKADKSVGHGFTWHFYLDPEETPSGEIAFRPVNVKARRAIEVRTVMAVAEDILKDLPIPMTYTVHGWSVDITVPPADE